MLHTLISFTPFMVCLFWVIVFVLDYRRHDPAKKVLTWFLLTCTILYLCHALFFTTGRHHPLDCIWALCSLSVYPIFLIYLRTLTKGFSDNNRQYLALIPGFVFFLILLFNPGSSLDVVRTALFTVQIAVVLVSGTRMLQEFDREVESFYADTEGRETGGIKKLLIAFVITSIISAVASALGRSYFGGDDRLLLAVSFLFASLLFAISYIGYTREFSYSVMSMETEEEEEEAVPENGQDSEETLGRKLDELMERKQIFLEKGLKINDVAKEIGSCRTYVSNYLNKTKGETFSDYINRLRIEHALTVLEQDHQIKNIALAERLGFASEQSFYRNFKKFTGKTPAQWKEEKKRN